MTSDLEKSFKAKLRALALEKHRDPADLWQRLVLERFLVRLSKSAYHSHFVLKGAILLACYIDIGRETRDLDFLARSLSNEIQKLKGVFEEIAVIDLQDGFIFRDVSVAELLHPHMGYSGAEIAMMAHFGRTRFKTCIDVGFGDLVDPIEEQFPLMSSSKGPLFEKAMKVICYPKEFIFAEKLETVIHRGQFNSRMKDFHDLHSLIEAANHTPLQNLTTVVHAVFKHRGTTLVLPVQYDETGLNLLQQFWNGYLKNLRAQELAKLPIQFAVLLAMINDWLLKHL